MLLQNNVLISIKLDRKHPWVIKILPFFQVPRGDNYVLPKIHWRNLDLLLLCFIRWAMWPTGSLFCFHVIGIPNLAHECITMGQCVTYIHDLCMTLPFDLNIKIILLPWICVWARSSLFFDIGILNLAQGCITVRQHVVYIHVLCMILTYMWGNQSELYS